MDILSYKLGQNSIEPDKPDQDKTATPSTQQQIIRADAGYELASVTIEAIQTETKNVTPTTSSQTITPTTGKFIDEINVSAVTSSIDNNLRAENIKKDVVILGTTGTYETHTGAYKVNSIAEMNNIDDMETGDYCVIENNISGYTQIEYLESSGTEYINTDVLPHTTETSIKTEVVFQKPTLDTSATGDEYVVSAYNGNRRRYYPVVFSNTADVFRTTTGTGTTTSTKITINYGEYDNKIHKVVYNGTDNKVYYDDVEKGTLQGGFTTNATYPIYLFALDNSGPEQEFFTGRIYYVKFWDNATGNLVRNMIPVKRNSDDELGMYDLVNNVFYTNLGTGAFTGGNEIEPYILYQYNGSTWTDITDNILVPTTTITPSNEQQTLEIPPFYNGFKNVTINAMEHTGAYKVQSYNDMLEITTMQDGDLCYIEDINIYPTTDVTFTKYTGTTQDFSSGLYEHNLFIFASTTNSGKVLTYNDSNGYLANTSVTITNDTIQGNKNSSYVLILNETSDHVRYYPKFTANNKYIYCDNADLTSSSHQGYIGASVDGTDLNYTTPTKFNALLDTRSGFGTFKITTDTTYYGGSDNYYLDMTNSNYSKLTDWYTTDVYTYEMQTSGNLYQYQTGTGWVDISETGDAIATDIKEGKTAYVNGKLVTGALPEVISPASICNEGSNFYNGQFFKPQDSISGSNKSGCYLVTGELGVYNGTLYLVNWVTVTALQSWFIQNQSKVKVGMPATTIATKIGLRPNVIKSGVTILGVTGTYTGE